MDATNQLLKEFQSNGGNQEFIPAIKSITGSTQTMENCWIKSVMHPVKSSRNKGDFLWYKFLLSLI